MNKIEYYSCKLDDLEQLKLFPPDKIRWLNVPDDFDLIKKYYKIISNSDTDINEADFSSNQWKMCALFENEEIVSFAGILYMTDKNWELGAVSTHPEHKNKGYSTMICSFVSKYILEKGKQVTCNTKIDNYPMQRVMRKIGMIMQ